MIHLATFSDSQMSRSRALCIDSALQHGVGRVAGPHYFDPGIEYRDGFTLEWLKSQPIYDQMGADWWTQRGCGYWLWKPYIIDQVMGKLPDGDLILYADAGIEFIDNTRYIVDRMDQDVWLFGNNWEHVHWCKADVLYRVAVEPTGDMRWVSWDRYGKQCQASVIFLRVTEHSRRFVAEWLKWCLWHDGALINDSPSGILNHPEFQEHRHDQAILTTLAYREGIHLHWWPSVYNRFVGPEFVYEKLPYYADDTYPPIFHHHRLRNHEFDAIRPSIETHVSV